MALLSTPQQSSSSLTAKEQATTFYQMLCARKAYFRRRQGHTEQAKSHTIDCFASHIARQQPLPFVLYWAKGPYDADCYDIPKLQGIRFIHQHLSRLAEHYAHGIRLDVVVADTHETLNNNHVSDADMVKIAHLFIRAMGETGAFNAEHLTISRLSNYTPMPDMQQLDAQAASSELRHQPELLAAMAARAKHYYRGCTRDFDGEMAACHYYELCKSEKDAVGAAFSNHIFLTYNTENQHWSNPTGCAILGHNAARLPNEQNKPTTMIDKPWNVTFYTNSDSDLSHNLTYGFFYNNPAKILIGKN